MSKIQIKNSNQKSFRETRRTLEQRHDEFAKFEPVDQKPKGYEGPKRKFIYGLVDPRDGTIRYVGQTMNVARRLFNHAKHTCNKGLEAWFKELAPRLPRTVVLGYCHKGEADTWENYWMVYWANRGKLYNVYLQNLRGLLKRSKRCKRRPAKFPKQLKRVASNGASGRELVNIANNRRQFDALKNVQATRAREAVRGQAADEQRARLYPFDEDGTAVCRKGKKGKRAKKAIDKFGIYRPSCKRRKRKASVQSKAFEL